MFARSTLPALLLLAGIVPANADPASEALLRDFIGSIDAAQDWTAKAGAVRSEGGDTVAEALEISRTAPDVSIKVERLRLGDLTGAAAGGFSASRIELTGAAMVSPDSEMRIPTASVQGVRAPGVTGIEYDPSHLMTFMARLYTAMADAEFSNFSVPEMTVVAHPPPAAEGATQAAPDVSITYRNLSIDALQGGVMGLAQAGPISVESRTNADSFNIEIASVRSERMDVGAVAHVLDDSQYPDGKGDAVWRPLLSRVSYSGFSGSGSDGTTFKLDDVAVENIDARQPEKPMNAAWDRILDPSVPEDAKSDLALEALTNMASAWRVGTIRLGGLAIENARDGFTGGLAAFTMSGLSQEGIDSVILKSLQGMGPNGFGKLDSFEMAGFQFPDSKALMQLAALEEDAEPAKHAQTVRSAFAALPRLTHLAMEGLGGGKSPTEAVTIQRFSMDYAGWNEIFAEQTDMRLEGLAIPVELMQLPPEQLQIMQTLGFDRLVLGSSFTDRWSPEAGTDDSVWKLTLEDGADVELTYRLKGLTIDWIVEATAAAAKSEDDQSALMRMLADLSLERAGLAVTDRSLLDRSFGVAAQKQNLSIDGKAYREQMRGALPFLLSAALPPELSKLLTPPLQAFMAGGQKLIAEVNPPSPVPVLELAAGAADPMALVDRLGITIRSEAP